MSKQFINEPPTFEKPGVFFGFEFLSRRYEHRPSVNDQIRNIINWAKKERYDAIRLSAKLGNMKNVQFLSKEFPAMRLLSILSVFDDIVNYFNKNPYVWNSLDRDLRNFLTDAHEFRKLSNQRILEV